MEYPSSKQQLQQQQQQPNSAVVAAATRTFVVRCSSSDSSQSPSQQRNSEADRRIPYLIVVVVGIFMALLLPSKKWCFAIDFIRNNISNNNDNKKGMNWSVGNIPFFLLLFGIALLMTITFFSTCKHCEELEHVVSVYPLGVQLSTCRRRRRHDDDNNNTTQRTLQQPPPPLCFIPREDVIDVIVSEVVLSYKVVSVLLFRTRRRRQQNSQPLSSLSSTTPSSINNFVSGKSSIDDFTLEQRRTKVQLIPVFPVDDMTYQQCLTMRDQISQCLGLP